MGQAPSLLEILRMSTGYLREHGSDSARLDAELLCAHALKLRRLDLYLQFNRPLRADELTAIRELVRRRGQGEPVAYIVGVREFYGREFAVGPSVLVPRPDTESVVEEVLRWCVQQGGPAGAGFRIADLGTGSGCIAVTLAAELPGAQVAAVDLSPEAVAVGVANAALHGVADRVSFLTGSWCEPLAGLAPFDVVVSNPPYITDAEMAALPRDVAGFEPRLALAAGTDGLAPFRLLAAGIPAVIGLPALVALEIDPRRVEAVLELLRAAMPHGTVTAVDDLTGRPRVCRVTLPRETRSTL